MNTSSPRSSSTTFPSSPLPRPHRPSIKLTPARRPRPSHPSKPRPPPPLDLGGNPFEPQRLSGSGGWTRQGEWEEWTGNEEAALERLEEWEHRRAERLLDREAQRNANPALEEEQDEQEIPSEFVQTDDLEYYAHLSQSQPIASTSAQTYTNLPPLASDSSEFYDQPVELGDLPSSTPPISSSQEQDYEQDTLMLLSSPLYITSSPVPSPTPKRRTHFLKTVLQSNCPACTEQKWTHGLLMAEQGVGCIAGCGWGFGTDVLGILEREWGNHLGVPEEHDPLLTYSPFTGTIIFCTACDEQVAL